MGLPEWFVVSGVGAIAISALLSTIVGDLAVRALYENDRSTWERTGRPFGMIWLPRGTKGEEMRYAFDNRSRLSDALREAQKATLSLKTSKAIQRYVRFKRCSAILLIAGIFSVIGGCGSMFWR